MNAVALAARLVLAAVLSVAAGAKATARERPNRWESLVVPALELVTAVLLVVRPDAPQPAWFAAVMLVAFTVVLVRTRARTPGAPCPCFGALSRAPITGRTIMRNGVLIALAVLATGTRR